MKNYSIVKTINITSLVLLLITFTSCNKNDDDTPDCVKDENFFEAEFRGEVLKPYYISGGGIGGYTLGVQRNPENNNDWSLSIGVGNDIYLNLWLKNINNIGNYPIETGSIDDIGSPFAKSYISISNPKLADPDINNGSPYTYFSLENTGNYKITKYNTETGILVGTFNCDMKSTRNEEIISISGEFNINLSTLDTSKKPCFVD